MKVATRWFLAAATSLVCARLSESQSLGLNVALDRDPTPQLLAELALYGEVLDVIPQIDAVLLRSTSAGLAAVRTLPYVLGANADAPRSLLSTRPLSMLPPAIGVSTWNLDAIDVADVGGTRSVPYDGEGVYVAVIDSGLMSRWREYFPEERIATDLARCFGGGGGNRGTISSQPERWEQATFCHGTAVTGIVLGFDYYGQLAFDGVAPRATVIPVRVSIYEGSNFWSSVGTRALMYLADLKTSGALGSAPLVVNMSFGDTDDPDFVEQAAIDYAIAQGIVIVASAGNYASQGMGYPAAYPPVISVGASGWKRQWPQDDPTLLDWILRDVPETDASEHFIADFSSHELPGQDLDVIAPGFAVPTPWANQSGRSDFSFFFGTSAAAPHVAGIAALMLQKKPSLTQQQIESILEATAMPLAAGCRDVRFALAAPGNGATWSDHDNVFVVPGTICWDANAVGHGLVQVAAALAATPSP